jgi:phosphoribosylformylglycinamidine synthase
MAEFLALRGAAAFSASRLARLQKSVGEQFAGVTLAAEHWYFVELERALSADEQSRLGDLLGIPSPLPAAPAGSLLLVTPRLGTISPWSSKATDIARNCGFAAVKRIERGTAYHLAGKGQESALATRRISTLLHDRMTESVLDSIDAARELFRHYAPQPLTTVDILGGGKRRAGAANGEMGLALSDDEIDYLVENFTQARAQPDRRRADDVRPGQFRALPPQDLQRRLDRRRRRPAAVPVRHDPRDAQGQSRTARWWRIPTTPP